MSRTSPSLVAFSLLVGIAPALSVAQEPMSQQELEGTWNFRATAELETPEQNTPVGLIMEFRPDGTIVSKMPKGDQEAVYRLDGGTIRYRDANGEQIWEIRSFEPDTSFVVENRGTLMFFERPKTDASGRSPRKP
jgi:hypothetical protein